MKSFKQFMLESGETGRSINDVKAGQLFQLHGKGSTLPKDLTLGPLNDTRNTVVSKPKPSTAAKPAPTAAAKPASKAEPWWNPKLLRPDDKDLTNTIHKTLKGKPPTPTAAKPIPKK